MKNIKYSLLAVLAILGMASCSNDYEYTPADPADNAWIFPNQVYFLSATLDKSVVELSSDETSYDIVIKRNTTEGEATLDVVFKQGEESTTQLTAPATVTFADGEEEATISLTYDPTTIDFDDANEDTLTLVIQEGSDIYLNPASSKYVFSAVIPSPWTSLGMATFTEGCLSVLYGADAITYKVEIQENDLQPGYYRLVNPYGAANPYNEEGDYDDSQTYYLYIHAEDPDFVYIPFQYMGVDWGDGEFGFMDFAYYYMANGKAPEDVKAAGYGGTLKEGIMTWPTKGLLIALGDEGYWYGNSTGEFEIILPGYTKADYSAEALFAGILKTPAEENQAVVDFTFGADIVSAKYALTAASVSEDEAAAAIVSGELEAVEITEAGRYYIPVTEDGKYRVVVVGYNADGEAKATASCVFEFSKGGSVWESLGMRWYTDDFTTMGGYDEESGEWSAVFGINSPITYPVEVFAHTSTPGLYRLKNAYGEANPYNEEGDWDPSMDYYLEIDATDPNYVMINKQELGCNWYNLGMMSVESDGSYYVNKYGMTPAEIVAAITSQGGEDPFGKLADGIITFPAADVFEVSFGEYSFYGNHNSAFKVNLNEEVVDGSETKAAKFASRLRQYGRLSKQINKKKANAISGKVHKALKIKSANAKKFHGKLLK